MNKKVMLLSDLQISSQKRIAVGLSGGVDSSVTAALLKEQGYDVYGFFMKNWDEKEEQCTIRNDWKDAQAIANQLNIPIDFVDLSDRYWNDVFESFLTTLETGGTPSPDILCNQYIKFGAFWDYCQKQGFSHIATGHYARINEYHQLCQPKDKHKDQTYFLWSVDPNIWKHVLFPLAPYCKPEVRELAKKFHLPTAEKKDSTGVCFIGPKKFRSFIQRYLVQTPGPICTTTGKILGQHPGLYSFTLGQRSGLGIGGVKNGTEAPWYVIEKDLKNNCLVIDQDANHPNLMKKEIVLKNPTWQLPMDRDSKALAWSRIRHGQELQKSEIVYDPDLGQWKIIFEKEQRAVAPGQCAVVYRDDGLCLGGGWISQ